MVLTDNKINDYIWKEQKQHEIIEPSGNGGFFCKSR